MLTSDLRLVAVCRPDNDLYRALAGLGSACARHDDLAGAVAAAPPGGAVLCLADDYPTSGPSLDQRLLEQAAVRGLRLYVEYPASLPGLPLGLPRPTGLERLVVSSDFFEPALATHQILAQHGCWLRPAQIATAHLVAARVAGYRRAIYGLPEETFPILFELPGNEVLVALSKLSGFVTGRYAPAADWQAAWRQILRWLLRSEAVPSLAFRTTVAVQAGPDDALPEGAESAAFARSVRWFREEVLYSVDWKKGVIEGFESAIDHQGRQARRVGRRADCTAEAALVLACDFALTGSPDSRRLTGLMLDYVWSSPDYLQADPTSPAYGLVNWYERGPVFYGDDNARVILATLAAGRLLGDERWDEHVLRCILANLRTTGRLGFRRNRVDLDELGHDSRAWQFFRDEELVSYSPHYQAYLWATFLWAYALTGYEGFLQPARDAIGMTMQAYPKWQWTNGFTQELARMLLPLAFLVRVDDSPEHRGWLSRVAMDLLANAQPCGAIREEMGRLADGRYPSPGGNERYGLGEASIIQENGDPACDLLYTTNYAFLGLHEAAAASADDRVRQAEDRLADFLCRIQVRSSEHRYLDGAWPRSFDFDLWEYWGSSADASWGAWSVESGWTNSWIAVVLALRLLGQTLSDRTTGGRLARHLSRLLAEML